MSKLLLVLSGAAIAFGFAAINYAASGDLRAVQAGEVELVCDMRDDEARKIAPSQVTGLMDGVWLFDNGHSRNCEVIKGVSYEK